MKLKNTRHTIEIKDVTAKGFGVGEIDNFTVFVDGGLPGDKVNAQIVKEKRTYCYGKIIEIIMPSPFRKKSPCRLSNNCGGCQWMHCDYEAQLGFKKDIVINTLKRLGGIENPPVCDVIGMENPGRYRNKAVFPIVPVWGRSPHFSDDFAIGMFAPRSHRIIEVEDCLIQHIAHVKILAALRQFMRKYKISAYDETAHKGLMRHIIIRTSTLDDLMVVLIVNGKFPKVQEFAETLTELGVSTMLVSKNTSKGNTILGEDFQIITGGGFIREKIVEIEYQLSAPSFFQVNPVQTKILYETAISLAELDNTQTVIDAHVGVGGVALLAARHVKHILGVDIVQAAIDDAKKNAALNNIQNAEFICGAAEDIIPKLMQEQAFSCGVSQAKEGFWEPPSVVFLDPPRKGCDPVLLNALIAAQIEKIVYISCDPATLARDIKILTAGGFLLKTVQPVDMFPFTGKVECVALLRYDKTVGLRPTPHKLF